MSSKNDRELIARAILWKNDALLVNANRNAKTGESYVALPGGHVDPGEHCVQALQREIEEELAAQCQIGDLQFVSENIYPGRRKSESQRHELTLSFRGRNQRRTDGRRRHHCQPGSRQKLSLAAPQRIGSGQSFARRCQSVFAGPSERPLPFFRFARLKPQPFCCGPNFMSSLIEIAGLTKSYQVEKTVVHALQGVDLTVPSGQFLAIIGRSGCGKSTLLNLLGGLDTPSEGQLSVGGADVAALDERGLTNYRRDTVGIVFQFFNLMPLLTATENAALPALLAGKPKKPTFERARMLLEKVGLGHRLDQGASLLSGGEMQRVAVARALINDPLLILADEPTGNLDSQSSQAVLDALRELTRDEGKTVVMVTHSREAAAIADVTREMRDGAFVAG